MMNEIFFTGTRKGMTVQQMRVLHELLMQENIGAFHQGLCKGSDIHAATIAASLGFDVHGHPPAGQGQWMDDFPCHHFHPALPALERDRVMVDVALKGFATPRSANEQKRGSGTWYTIRYAWKTGTPCA